MMSIKAAGRPGGYIILAPEPDTPMTPAAASPFDLDNDTAYRRWREVKLARAPATADLVVEVGDPRNLSDAEFGALHDCLLRANMVIYAGATGEEADKGIPRRLGRRCGLERLDDNYLSDEDGITSLTVNPQGEHPRYIPYTDRPIRWHTDGYYNPPERRIRGLLLHCVQSAGEGGENGLFDPEILYILLRDEAPELVQTLMEPDVMTIPPGTDYEGGARGAVTGPVFWLDAEGNLQMRYTARKRNIEWRPDGAVQAAVARLEQLLDSDLPYLHRLRLEPGMGLVANNVLHDRTGFRDLPGQKRLLYRARYVDRVAGTGWRDLLGVSH